MGDILDELTKVICNKILCVSAKQLLCKYTTCLRSYNLGPQMWKLNYWALFTLYWIAFASTLKPYSIGLPLTHHKTPAPAQIQCWSTTAPLRSRKRYIFFRLRSSLCLGANREVGYSWIWLMHNIPEQNVLGNFDGTFRTLLESTNPRHFLHDICRSEIISNKIRTAEVELFCCLKNTVLRNDIGKDTSQN